MYMLFVVFIASMPIWWNKAYGFVRCPRRQPDFQHTLYDYWFDEKIAWSKIADKKIMKFYEWADGRLYEDHGRNAKYFDLIDADYSLPQEVQDAYRYHIHKKFEEICLDGSIDSEANNASEN